MKSLISKFEVENFYRYSYEPRKRSERLFSEKDTWLFPICKKCAPSGSIVLCYTFIISTNLLILPRKLWV